jgi:hypothetical protein
VSGGSPARRVLLLRDSPDTADDLADARRTGGPHRRKKRTVATIYGFGGLRSIEDHQALLETVAVETLGLENSIARNRAITAIVATGAKLVELGDLASRSAAIEATLSPHRRSDEESGFPTEGAA